MCSTIEAELPGRNGSVCLLCHFFSFNMSPSVTTFTKEVPTSYKGNEAPEMHNITVPLWQYPIIKHQCIVFPLEHYCLNLMEDEYIPEHHMYGRLLLFTGRKGSRSATRLVFSVAVHKYIDALGRGNTFVTVNDQLLLCKDKKVKR